MGLGRSGGVVSDPCASPSLALQLVRVRRPALRECAPSNPHAQQVLAAMNGVDEVAGFVGMLFDQLRDTWIESVTHGRTHGWRRRGSCDPHPLHRFRLHASKVLGGFAGVAFLSVRLFTDSTFARFGTAGLMRRAPHAARGIRPQSKPRTIGARRASRLCLPDQTGPFRLPPASAGTSEK